MKLKLNNKIFGRWKVISKCNSDKNGNSKWLCVCNCGIEKEVYQSSLLNGRSISCGCYNREQVSKSGRKHGEGSADTQTPEYIAWYHMKYRCSNSNCKSYKNYGGKKVKVCERWMGNNGYTNFLEDMGRRPSEIHSLDRHPNIEGNYEPSNCRWATPAQQNRGKRKNKWLEHNGEKMILIDWAKKWGISYQVLQKKLKKNIPFESIFNYHEHGIKIRKYGLKTS